MRILFVVVWPITTNSGETKYKKQQLFELLLFLLKNVSQTVIVLFLNTRFVGDIS